MTLKNINILNLKLKPFNISIIAFEILIVFFMVYEIALLNNIQKDLAKAHSNKYSMIQASDRLRQSSDDLTHFARSYAVTEHEEFEKRYLDTLKIRNGKKERPIGYNAIYWDLDKRTRELKHPQGEKKSLKSIIVSLPFTQKEMSLLKTSEQNADDLVQIEVEAFSAIKQKNYEKAVKLLHSKDYYRAKHKMMLPIDEMMVALEKRTKNKISTLEQEVQNEFNYIFIVGFIFIIGNMLIYLLIHKKINKPIKYLTNAIKNFQNEELHVEKKEFYQDEIGFMIEQFFIMQNSITNQKNILTHLNENLKQTVEDRISEINTQNVELESLLSSVNKYIIISNTDLKGIITYASEAFCNICEYSENELIGQPHNILRHWDMPKEAFKDMWETIRAQKSWRGEVKNLKKNGGFYWVDALISPEYNSDGVHIGYSAIRHDITAQKMVEEISSNLEVKVKEKTKDLQREKKFIQTLLDSQEQLIITTDGNEIISANETFLDFFAIDSVEDFKKEYNGTCICDAFNKDAPEDYLRSMMENERWIDYVISRSFDHTHKVLITRDSRDFIFSVSAAKLPNESNNNINRKSAVFTDITEMERTKREIESIHKRTRESIEYAALIQSALIPDNSIARKHFKDYFAIWHPKDMVGGDIYLFEELRDKEECLLMVIDCTGHGVPGAFVTMLVKAIERSIVSRINHSDEVVSPAKLLSIFNSSMKHILKQNDTHSISNAGFDGQILYYNKKEKIIKLASARNEIFYFQDDTLHVIKGDRHSVGYKNSDSNYKFTEHTIDVSKETTLYMLTDGYWDQYGGEKGIPFGKKRLKNLLEEIHDESMADQQEEFLYTMSAYRDSTEQVDDITVVGIKI